MKDEILDVFLNADSPLDEIEDYQRRYLTPEEIALADAPPMSANELRLRFQAQGPPYMVGS